MKPIKTFLTILFISLLSSPSWSETMDDLVERNGLYYTQLTDIPFTGEITGDEQVSFKNGKREGAFVSYYENGQLSDKGNYKDGKRAGTWVGCWNMGDWENGQLAYKVNYKNDKEDGTWVGYYDNGQLQDKGNFKNGEREGSWVSYGEDGQLSDKGNFKNGYKEGAWAYYFSNGHLLAKGNYKNRKLEGVWISYNEDGTVRKKYTGTFKNGKKISDGVGNLNHSIPHRLTPTTPHQQRPNECT